MFNQTFSHGPIHSGIPWWVWYWIDQSCLERSSESKTFFGYIYLFSFWDWSWCGVWVGMTGFQLFSTSRVSLFYFWTLLTKLSQRISGRMTGLCQGARFGSHPKLPRWPTFVYFSFLSHYKIMFLWTWVAQSPSMHHPIITIIVYNHTEWHFFVS